MRTFTALQFAMQAHAGQTRKYTNEPYIVHPIQVAGLIGAVDSSDRSYCVALLHDVIEDCGVTHENLVHVFGPEIAFGVQMLSDMETGNRAYRKEASRIRLSCAPFWVQNIKVCDLIANTSSILTHDPKFAKTYLEEKRLLLNVLTKADERLILIARNQIEVNV